VKTLAGRKKGIRKALVVCNGRLLSKKAMLPLLNERPFVLCADGGANKSRRLGIRPNVIVGDLDSISPATGRFFARVKTIHIEDQESTDLEKSFDYLLSRKIIDVVVLGAMGGRPDHSLANLSILMKYRTRLKLRYSDSHCDIQIINRRIELDIEVGSIVSLMPLGRCLGITTVGLKYPLRNESLELGVREGTSNEVISSPAKISVRSGNLLLFTLKKQ